MLPLRSTAPHRHPAESPGKTEHLCDPKLPVALLTLVDSNCRKLCLQAFCHCCVLMLSGRSLVKTLHFVQQIPTMTPIQLGEICSSSPSETAFCFCEQH